MAALMFSVPQDTARVLGEIGTPGKPESDKHITVVYLGKKVPVEDLAEMIPVLHEVTSKTAPFTVSSEWVTTFPAGKDGTPVIARVQSPALHSFRQELCAALDRAGMEYDCKYPDYKPHVTLSYSEEETEFDLDMPALTWSCSELCLWGADRGQGELVVKFPLSIQSNLKRAMVQLSRWSKA